jgi:hypothetical protein
MKRPDNRMAEDVAIKVGNGSKPAIQTSGPGVPEADLRLCFTGAPG